jgi:hypothetical protein
MLVACLCYVFETCSFLNISAGGISGTGIPELSAGDTNLAPAEELQPILIAPRHPLNRSEEQLLQWRATLPIGFS